MFYIITLMSIALIVYGFNMKKSQAQNSIEGLSVKGEKEAMGLEKVKPMSAIDHEKFMEEIFEREEFLLLRSRVEDVEGALFRNLLTWQEEKDVLLKKIEMMEKNHKVQMNNLRDTLMDERDLSLKKSRRDAEDVDEIILTKKIMPPHIRAVVEYEKEGRSVSEIANLTKMNKGEVLLLKNLSKHYEA